MSPTSKRQPIQFGKYLLLDRINIGGMAEVWRGKAFGPDAAERLVAIKRILPNIAEDEEFNSMFIFEAKISVQLTHANIAQILDLGQISNNLFIAMEYIPGRDMRAIFDRCRKQGEPAPIPLACHLISQVCDGLDYAHRKKDATGQPMHIVHRDVSPANVLVSYDGEVKVIDFGIAKAAGKATRTQAGILKGKFAYMSPEQLLIGEIDHRADIFAIGICLFEMLTGERLFVGETDFAVLEKVRDVVVPAPTSVNPRIPEELERITLKALAGDRDQRYQHASDLAMDLRRFMDSGRDYFGRKELSQYMKEAFAEELEREDARLAEYAEIRRPEGLDTAPAKPAARTESTTALPKPRVSSSAIPVLVQPPRRTVSSMAVQQIASADDALEATGTLEPRGEPSVATAVNALEAEETEDEEDEAASTLMIGQDVVRAALGGGEPGRALSRPNGVSAREALGGMAGPDGVPTDVGSRAEPPSEAKGAAPNIPVLTPTRPSSPSVSPVLVPPTTGQPRTVSGRPALTPKPQSLEARARVPERPSAKDSNARITLPPSVPEPEEVTDPGAVSRPPLPPSSRTPQRAPRPASVSPAPAGGFPVGKVVPWVVATVALVVAVVALVAGHSTPDQGYLVIDGVPSSAWKTAELNINGKNEGVPSSWPALETAPVGPAVVMVSAPGFRSVTQEVRVTSGTMPAQVTLALQPLQPMAKLAVVADPPSAELSIGGKPAHRQGDGWVAQIPVGQEVTVEARAKGYAPSTRKARATSEGQVVLVRIALASKSRPVQVSSTPSGAEILDGDRLLGHTPMTVRLAGDVRSLTLRKHCFGDVSLVVEPVGDAASPLELEGTLKPDPGCR